MRHAVSPPRSLSYCVYEPCLNWKTCCAPGEKTTLDDENVRVAESLQDGHGLRGCLTTMTIDHHWYISGGSCTPNLGDQQGMRAPPRPRDVGHAKLIALTLVDQAEIFSCVQSRFQVLRGDKRDLRRRRAAWCHDMLL